jgi:hypothetical protein
MLKLLNGGLIDHNISYPQEILDYANEILNIHETIYYENISKEKIIKRKCYRQFHQDSDIYNIKAKVTNHVILDYENQALITIFNYFSAKKAPPSVLIFDGLMIEKQYFKNQNINQLLKECSDYIYNEMAGLRITLVVKEMETDIIYIDDQSNIYYETVKKQFEVNKFKSIGESRFYVNDDGVINKYTRLEFFTSFEHLTYIDENGNDKRFITEWLRDKNIRCYKNVGCYPPPLKCPDEWYNLWDGFLIEKSHL